MVHESYFSADEKEATEEVGVAFTAISILISLFQYLFFLTLYFIL